MTRPFVYLCVFVAGCGGPSASAEPRFGVVIEEDWSALFWGDGSRVLATWTAGIIRIISDSEFFPS